MSGQHTQGRLHARYEWLIPADQLGRPIGLSSDKIKNRDYYANIVATVSGSHHDYLANARRLAACWNLCEHVSTNDVEMMSKGGGLVEVLLAVSARGAMADGVEISSLKKQLDDAIALLKSVLDEDDGCIAELHGGDHPTASTTDEFKALVERIRAFLKGQP